MSRLRSTPLEPRPRSSRLWWYAAWMACPLLMFAASYPLPRHYGQLADIGILSNYQVVALALYAGGIGVMFALYLAALRLAMSLSGTSGLRPVIAGGALFAALMVVMYPVNAIDVFIYTVRSRIFTTYGENPQGVTPETFAADPLMAFSSAEWSVTVSPYGPLWNLIAAPITAVAGDNMLAALIGFKLLAAVAVLAGGWLIAGTLKAANIPVAAGVLLYLWNPLVLWEGIGNGHNDTVMMVPVLAAILAWSNGRYRAVIPLLVVAAMIKYVAILALPLAVVAIWRRLPDGRPRLSWLYSSVLFSGAVVFVSFAPFFDPAAAWRSLTEQGAIYLTSPAAVAISILREILGGPEARLLVSAACLGLMALFLVAQLALTFARPDRLPRALFETTFVFLLIATWNFRVWYVIWLVALAAVLPIGWPAWRAVAWSAGGLAGYILFIWIWHWWDVEFPVVHALGVLILTGPAAIVTLIELARSDQPPHRPQPVPTAMASSPAGEWQ